MTSPDKYSTQTPNKSALFSGQYLRNRSTLDIGVLGYIGIVWPKEHSSEVWSVPSVTPCIPYLIWEKGKFFCFILSSIQPGIWNLQGCSNMTGTSAACLHTNQSRSYLNHLVFAIQSHCFAWHFWYRIFLWNLWWLVLSYYANYCKWKFFVQLNLHNHWPLYNIYHDCMDWFP